MSNGVQATILIVEDQAPMRRLMVQMLAENGIPALEAGTAEAGLEAVRNCENPIGLAIIDIVMPGITGLDLAAELSRCRPDLPILFVSGYVESLAVEIIMRQTPEAVLLKPFTEEDLVGRVRLLLNRRFAAGAGSAIPAEPISTEHRSVAGIE